MKWLTLAGAMCVAMSLPAMALPGLARSVTGAAVSLPQKEKKDYLSPLEADQIRDAPTVSDRVKLFLGFAADRLRKIDYELQRKEKDRLWSERVSSLINAYSGCVDDAADFLEAGLEKQENLRPGTKELDKRTKEFLPKLRELRENPLLAAFKSDIGDAIEATQEAAKTAEKVAKELSAAPERRRP
ncbi:MAG TPA: hypothetical protein VJW51_11060 [Candidatus Acidoferrales bacterium]|nr:hypothetical protein [Candidatus Acidoferrales bacterium]